MEMVMSIRERVVEEIGALSEAELKQVADYLAFLRFQGRFRHNPESDEAKLAALYAEFAEEDRELAEEGLADYVAQLAREDAA
jgi:hypothetical protein